MSEFTDVYNEVSEMLEKNTLELIAKLQYIVDNVEDRFDLQDSDFNLKELSKNEWERYIPPNKGDNYTS